MEALYFVKYTRVWPYSCVRTKDLGSFIGCFDETAVFLRALQKFPCALGPRRIIEVKHTEHLTGSHGEVHADIYVHTSPPARISNVFPISVTRPTSQQVMKT